MQSISDRYSHFSFHKKSYFILKPAKNGECSPMYLLHHLHLLHRLQPAHLLHLLRHLHLAQPFRDDRKFVSLALSSVTFDTRERLIVVCVHVPHEAVPATQCQPAHWTGVEVQEIMLGFLFTRDENTTAITAAVIILVACRDAAGHVLIPRAHVGY